MATTQLSYTPTLGTLAKWTFSGWFKKSAPTGYQQMIAVPSGSAYTVIKFETTGQISFENYDSGGSVAGQLKTTRIFRDCSAWYHIVAVWDSANATPGDRMKLYVNGVEETAFTTDVNPDSSETSTMCANVVHWIGANNGSDYFDGSMSWVQLVDNAALAPTQFGSFDTTSGIWKISPGAYGTPGTAGFCLAFEDRSNLDLDTSSNAYTFTTAGGGLTATYDNPSNNFCTLNALDEATSNPLTFSNGNLSYTSGAAWRGGSMTMAMGTKGKWYWEMEALTGTSLNPGVASIGYIALGSNGKETGAIGVTSVENGYTYSNYNGNIYYNVAGGSQTSSSYGNTYTTQVIGIACDLDNNLLYFYKDNVVQNSGTGFTIAADHTYIPYLSTHSSSANYNFGNGYFAATAITSPSADGDGYGAFKYAPPTGYYALCTNNINTYG